MSRLLKKVTDLEEKVTTDVNNKPSKLQDRRGSLLARLGANKLPGQQSDAQSNASSDKTANAKALLSKLFQKK